LFWYLNRITHFFCLPNCESNYFTLLLQISINSFRVYLLFNIFLNIERERVGPFAKKVCPIRRTEFYWAWTWIGEVCSLVSFDWSSTFLCQTGFSTSSQSKEATEILVGEDSFEDSFLRFWGEAAIFLWMNYNYD